jgi:hypothetical protein
MINGYKFGEMVIDNVPYRNDVIVFPDRVQDNWWRKEGHKLQVIDIKESIEQANPKTLVVGTGKFGVMRISKEVREYLDKQNITVYAEPTEKAVKIYNRLIQIETRIIGAFHLTC